MMIPTWFQWRVPSGFLREFAFDEDTQTLFVRLIHSPAVLVYRGVPSALVQQWPFAESPGRFYNREIRGRFERDELTEGALSCLEIP